MSTSRFGSPTRARIFSKRPAVVQVGFAVLQVEPPPGDPLVPRPDRAEQAHADLPEPGGRVHDPVQDARPVRDVLAQVGVEPGVDGAGPGQFTGDLQADVLGDLGPGTVGADQEPGPLGEGGVRDPVVQGDGHPVRVLGVAEVLGVEGDLRAALGGVGDQHRFHQAVAERRAWCRGCPAGSRRTGHRRCPRSATGRPPVRRGWW